MNHRITKERKVLLRYSAHVLVIDDRSVINFAGRHQSIANDFSVVSNIPLHKTMMLLTLWIFDANIWQKSRYIYFGSKTCILIFFLGEMVYRRFSCCVKLKLPLVLIFLLADLVENLYLYLLIHS